MIITMPVELYTDGSSLKNPGASGLGYVIRFWEQPAGSDIPTSNTMEGSQGFRLSTNNRMEIMAVIYGLNTIVSLIRDKTFEQVSQIDVSSDSEYFCKAVNQKWLSKWQQNNWYTSGFQGQTPKPVKNKDLWEQFLNIQSQIKGMNINLTVSHVKGHNGHEFNERADQLAVSASNGSDQAIDEFYEKSTDVKNR